jgi:hypothetical protein
MLLQVNIYISVYIYIYIYIYMNYIIKYTYAYIYIYEFMYTYVQFATGLVFEFVVVPTVISLKPQLWTNMTDNIILTGIELFLL